MYCLTQSFFNIDPCEGFTCPDNTVCMTNSFNNPTCRCQTNCQILGMAPFDNSTKSVYEGDFQVIKDFSNYYSHSYFRYKITKSVSRPT